MRFVQYWPQCRGGSIAGWFPGTCSLVSGVAVALICAGCGSTPAVPTLGQLAGLYAQGQGFGQVRPAEVFNGGDPTGLISHIIWKSWGGRRAVGTGTSDYVGPGQSVATGSEEHAAIIAFNLGICEGKLMYRAVEWYFPQHAQVFDPHQYENVCIGTYEPSSSG